MELHDMELADYWGKRLIHTSPAVLLHFDGDGSQSRRSVLRNRMDAIFQDDWSSITLHDIILTCKKSTSNNPKSTELMQSLLQKRVIKLCGNNNISKAYKSLDPMKQAPSNDKVYSKLKSLHPERLPENNFEFPPHTEFFKFTMEDTRRVIQQDKKGIMHGLSNMRAEHFKSFAANKGHIEGNKFCFSYTKLLTRIANGQISPGFATFFSNQSLTALQKDPNNPLDIRPICMVDLIRKHAGTLMLEDSAKEISDFFGHLQFAHAKSGTEKIIHTIRAALDIHPDYDLICIDLANVFNMMLRRVGMEGISEHFPKFIGFFKNILSKSFITLLPRQRKLRIPYFVLVGRLSPRMHRWHVFL